MPGALVDSWMEQRRLKGSKFMRHASDGTGTSRRQFLKVPVPSNA
jgi:hypothetical protein